MFAPGAGICAFGAKISSSSADISPPRTGKCARGEGISSPPRRFIPWGGRDQPTGGRYVPRGGRYLPSGEGFGGGIPRGTALGSRACSVRLSHSEIHRIRARLAQASSPAAAATGDEVALRSALARDACALSAHCADVERSREIFSSVIFDDGAWYYRCSEGGWGFDDGKGGNSASGAGLSRIDAARGARSFGPEREREYAPLDEATLAAIAARAKEFTGDDDDVDARCAHAGARCGFAGASRTCSGARRRCGRRSNDLFHRQRRGDGAPSQRHTRARVRARRSRNPGTNLDFDEAVRRGLFMSRLPEGVTEFPEWFVQDRADAAERERLKDEAEAPARAEEDRRRVEEERAKARSEAGRRCREASGVSAAEGDHG